MQAEQQENERYALVPYIWKALEWSRGETVARQYNSIEQMMGDWPELQEMPENLAAEARNPMEPLSPLEKELRRYWHDEEASELHELMEVDQNLDPSKEDLRDDSKETKDSEKMDESENGGRSEHVSSSSDNLLLESWYKMRMDAWYEFLGVKKCTFTDAEEEEITSPESVQEILDRFQELADRDAANRGAQPTRPTMEAEKENRAVEAAAQDDMEQRLQNCVNLFPHIYNALRWSRGEEVVHKYKTIKEVMDDFFGHPNFTKEEEEELLSRESIKEILDRFQELADREAAER
ncbi:hypothetical protein B9Z55_023436 [Caenorhabditis nigoni]|uniref:Uncharacterized protein n=1 Tax=Caenorhabditis nigoni TaxID=1611254 RepID=A0A2G5SPW0_9PELO|nr:hypothetical protein B9Z55_023436 [Caenorhabditis nigoni]